MFLRRRKRRERNPAKFDETSFAEQPFWKESSARKLNQLVLQIRLRMRKKIR